MSKRLKAKPAKHPNRLVADGLVKRRKPIPPEQAAAIIAATTTASANPVERALLNIEVVAEAMIRDAAKHGLEFVKRRNDLEALLTKARGHAKHSDWAGLAETALEVGKVVGWVSACVALLPEVLVSVRCRQGAKSRWESAKLKGTTARDQRQWLAIHEAHLKSVATTGHGLSKWELVDVWVQAGGDPKLRPEHIGARYRKRRKDW